MAGNLTHRGNILTVGECLCKNDFVQNKFLKIIMETMRARARAHVCVCTCVHTYVHSSDYAVVTFGRQCFNP